MYRWASQIGVTVSIVVITATTMGRMPMRQLRAIGADVLGASRCRMAFVSRIAVINRKSTQ